jgi:hypothetical protein
MIARPSTRKEARLVRFFGFLSSAQKETDVSPAMPSLDIVSESEERDKALASLLQCLSILGGIMDVCRLGAELFCQAVLLFRCLGKDTPSSIEISGGFGQDGHWETREGSNDQTDESSGVDSVVALRADRAPVARGSPARGSGGIDTTVE